MKIGNLQILSDLPLAVSRDQFILSRDKNLLEMMTSFEDDAISVDMKETLF